MTISAAGQPALSMASRLAIPAVLLGALFIGLSPIFVRLSELGPTPTAFWRMVLALPILWLWMRREEATKRQEAARSAPPVGKLALAGLLFAGDLYAWHWSIHFTSVANSTFLANFAVVLVAVGAWIFLGERPTRRFLAGLVVTVAGAAALVGGSLRLDPAHAWGDLLALVTAVFFAGYMLVVKDLRAGLGPAAILFWSSLVTAIALLPPCLIEGAPLLPRTAGGAGVLLGIAWISQAVGQGLITLGLGFLRAGFSSLVILAEPVMTAFLGWLLLAETLGPSQLVGGALLLSGVFVARRDAR